MSESTRHTGADALPDYAPMASAIRTDAQRWPLLSDAGLDRVRTWRAHPRAPVWRHACGDLLTEPDLSELSSYAATLAAAGSSAGVGGTSRAARRPAWVDELVTRCQAVVPRYRGGTVSFEQLAPVCRDDLTAAVASFVPDDLPLERLVQTSSSGTTGAALVLPQHPVTIAAELVLLERLVADAGAVCAAERHRSAAGVHVCVGVGRAVVLQLLVQVHRRHPTTVRLREHHGSPAHQPLDHLPPSTPTQRPVIAGPIAQ